jgi:ribosomal protein L32E
MLPKSFTVRLIILQIGYGNNKKTRHLRPSGHKVFLVHNARDVDMLLMYNRTYVAEIGMFYLAVCMLIAAHAVGAKKRLEIVAKAKKLGVAVTNGNARLTKEE